MVKKQKNPKTVKKHKLQKKWKNRKIQKKWKSKKYKNNKNIEKKKSNMRKSEIKTDGENLAIGAICQLALPSISSCILLLAFIFHLCYSYPQISLCTYIGITTDFLPWFGSLGIS